MNFPGPHHGFDKAVKDLLSLLIAIVFFGILHYFTARDITGRKRKDIYSFDLPEWSLNRDHQIIREIENDFKTGLIANTLGDLEYSISDFHSNLFNKNIPAFTGYVELAQLKKNFLMLVVPYGFLYRFFDKETRHKIGHRYFYGKINKYLPKLLHLNSTSIPHLGEMDSEFLREELIALETLFQVDNWQLISFGEKLYILTSEIFDQQQLNTYLKLCLIIQEKFNKR